MEHWGLDRDEPPGHAVEIDAAPDAVWPWLAQIGQDRAGFYSYEWLENLAGCQMHNAQAVHPEWQQRELGETVYLHPHTGMAVNRFDPGRAIGLEGWGSFELVPLPRGRTRLVARGEPARGAKRLFSVLLVEIPHFVMERKMLLGIKQRAEEARQRRSVRTTDAGRANVPMCGPVYARTVGSTPTEEIKMSPTTHTTHRVVVAGYDGSPASRAAVEVAAQRAGSTGKLVVVHAYEVPAEYLGAPYYQNMLDTKLDEANRVTDELEALDALDGVNWQTDLVVGRPGPAICRAAQTREADEIVIGTRGHGRFRAALGSVSMDVLHGAACPVVVIPERMLETGPTAGAATAAA